MFLPPFGSLCTPVLLLKVVLEHCLIASLFFAVTVIFLFAIMFSFLLRPLFSRLLVLLCE